MPIDEPVSFLLQQGAQSGRPLLSLEFFPPKTPTAAEEMLKNAEAIATYLHPDFVSITYGAGGSTRELTHLYSQILRERFHWNVMPHLTCVGHTREELLAIAENYARTGVRNIMALRGDAPKDKTIPTGDLKYASELVSLIKGELPELCLGVAGYPEKHPEAPSLENDIAKLKYKLEQGASFVTTQLFFDTEAYKIFAVKCREAGIRVPIIPGLLPILSLEQAQKFCAMCNAKLPEELEKKLKITAPSAQWEVGVDWTVQQIRELIKLGVPGVHLYILNRSKSLLRLARALREEGMFR